MKGMTQRVIIFIMVLIGLTREEDNDFDYSHHGADWPDSCIAPSSITLYYHHSK